MIQLTNSSQYKIPQRSYASVASDGNVKSEGQGGCAGYLQQFAFHRCDGVAVGGIFGDFIQRMKYLGFKGTGAAGTQASCKLDGLRLGLRKRCSVSRLMLARESAHQSTNSVRLNFNPRLAVVGGWVHNTIPSPVMPSI